MPISRKTAKSKPGPHNINLSRIFPAVFLPCFQILLSRLQKLHTSVDYLCSLIVMTSTGTYSFTKTEKLCNRKTIELLFAGGNSFFIAPFKVLWSVDNKIAAAAVQVVMIVPKRNFRNAVTRNRIKRIMREAYRLHKEALCNSLSGKSISFSVAIIMTGRKVPDFKECEQIIMLILQRLQQEHEKIAG